MAPPGTIQVIQDYLKFCQLTLDKMELCRFKVCMSTGFITFIKLFKILREKSSQNTVNMPVREELIRRLRQSAFMFGKTKCIQKIRREFCNISLSDVTWPGKESKFFTTQTQNQFGFWNSGFGIITHLVIVLVPIKNV